jgi:HAD superfamily hydrolase (TIGR01509 family)
MFAGILFDLGDTLITHTQHQLHDGSFESHRRVMMNDLCHYLQNADLLGDVSSTHFAHVFRDHLIAYTQQRQTSFLEKSTRYILAQTFAELNLPNLTDTQYGQAMQAFFSSNEAQWVLLPGTHATLQALQAKQFRLGLVSNAMDAGNVQRLLARFDLTHYFNPIVISATVGVRKPNPAIFEPVFAAWPLLATQIALVGDTLGADVLGAQQAGITSVWITTQATRPDNLQHLLHIVPDYTINTLPDLIPILDASTSP